MKILTVEMAEDGTVGGSHKMLASIVGEMEPLGYESAVLFYQDNPIATSMRDAGRHVETWDVVRAEERGATGLIGRLRRWVAGVGRRRRMIRDVGADVVHLNNLPTQTIEYWFPACWLERVPVVSHARGVMSPRPTLERLDGLRRWLAAKCDRVICVSEHVRDACTAAGIPRERSLVIYDGVDETHWAPPSMSAIHAARAELGLGDSDILILIAGNIKRWKGQSAALKALTSMQVAEGLRLNVILAGAIPDGPDEVGYVEEVRGLLRMIKDVHGIDAKMIGPQADLRPLYAAADVVVHCSIEPEPLGTVVLEALSMGKAIVGSSLGGPAEMLREGSGLLADPRDQVAFGKAMEAVINDPVLRDQLSDAALLRASQFRLRDYARNVCEVYHQVAR